MTTELATTQPGAVRVYQTAGPNAAMVYIASLQPGSQPTMRQALAAIATILHSQDPKSTPRELQDQYVLAVPWGALRYEHTQAIRAKLAAAYDARTVNKMLSGLRQTLKNAWRLGQMTADEYMAAADIKNVTGEKPDQAAGRALALGELMALVAACQDGTAAGARDAAMLAVSYSCGLRRAEVVTLDLQHFDRQAGVLTVHGKRNKSRTVPIQNGARAAVEDWLAVRGEQAGPLFVAIRKGGQRTGQRLTTQAVYYIFSERAQQAGVPAFSPHDMRRTFAGDLLDAGADIATVQKMMGHANVTTTAGYDRRGERAKQEAAKKLHFPYKGGK